MNMSERSRLMKQKRPDPCVDCTEKEAGVCLHCDYHRYHTWLIGGAEAMLDVLASENIHAPV